MRIERKGKPEKSLGVSVASQAGEFDLCLTVWPWQFFPPSSIYPFRFERQDRFRMHIISTALRLLH
jgi:hypothetical protein